MTRSHETQVRAVPEAQLFGCAGLPPGQADLMPLAKESPREEMPLLTVRSQQGGECPGHEGGAMIVPATDHKRRHLEE